VDSWVLFLGLGVWCVWRGEAEELDNQLLEPAPVPAGEGEGQRRDRRAGARQAVSGVALPMQNCCAGWRRMAQGLKVSVALPCFARPLLASCSHLTLFVCRHVSRCLVGCVCVRRQGTRSHSPQRPSRQGHSSTCKDAGGVGAGGSAGRDGTLVMRGSSGGGWSGSNGGSSNGVKHSNSRCRCLQGAAAGEHKRGRHVASAAAGGALAEQLCAGWCWCAGFSAVGAIGCL
jgi:hypothetical protein